MVVLGLDAVLSGQPAGISKTKVKKREERKRGCL